MKLFVQYLLSTKKYIFPPTKEVSLYTNSAFFSIYSQTSAIIRLHTCFEIFVFFSFCSFCQVWQMWWNFQFTDIWRRFVSVLAKRFFEKFLKTFKIYFYFTTKLNIAFAYQFLDWHRHRKIEKIRFHISLWQKHFLKTFSRFFFCHKLQCRICPDLHEIGLKTKCLHEISAINFISQSTCTKNFTEYIFY